MKRFLIVGDVNVDFILSDIHGFPVLGQECSCDNFSMLVGGSSANCACSLAGLGATVDFWGKVGCDALGDFVLRELQSRRVGISHMIQDPAIRTGACVALSYSTDRALVSYMASISSLRLEDIQIELISEYDHLHSGSIFIQQGLRPGFGSLFRTAKEQGLTTSLDSGWDPSEEWQIDVDGIIPYVDYFLPNEAEALQIAQKETILEAAEELSRFGKTIVVKRGRQGSLAQSGSHVWLAPAFAVETVETTGAGDCFNAGLLFGLIEKGWALPEAMKFANGCGAMCASSPGATSASPSAEEVEQFMSGKLSRVQ